MQAIEANWMVFGAALVVALLAAWWLFGRASRTPQRRDYKPDVLDEGVGPAQRNQALIDAPPAAQIVPPPVSPALGGLAEAVSIGAQDVVEEVRARAAPEPAPAPEPEPEPQPAPEPEPAAPPETAPQLPDESPRESPPPVQSAPVAAPQPGPELPDAPPAEAPPPQQAPAPAPTPAAEAAADDLSRIKGLGPKLQALLPTLGITTFAQIAAMSEADLAELDGKLGVFAGRPAKDNWVEQARFLASGDVAGFEAKFGKV